MEQDPRLKALQRATGIAKRCAKDVESYETEAVDLTAKLNKLVAENADQYAIKQQRQAVEETEAVIPDCRRRKEKAIRDLQALVAQHADLVESQEYRAATELLANIAPEE